MSDTKNGWSEWGREAVLELVKGSTYITEELKRLNDCILKLQDKVDDLALEQQKAVADVKEILTKEVVDAKEGISEKLASHKTEIKALKVKLAIIFSAGTIPGIIVIIKELLKP